MDPLYVLYVVCLNKFLLCVCMHTVYVRMCVYMAMMHTVYMCVQYCTCIHRVKQGNFEHLGDFRHPNINNLNTQLLMQIRSWGKPGTFKEVLSSYGSNSDLHSLFDDIIIHGVVTGTDSEDRQEDTRGSSETRGDMQTEVDQAPEPPRLRPKWVQDFFKQPNVLEIMRQKIGNDAENKRYCMYCVYIHIFNPSCIRI